MLKIELQYFPSVISYSALLKSSHIDFCIYDSWARQSFRNRMIVAGSNGLLTLSIPVSGGRNQKGLYRDIRIDHGADWQKRHWRSIFSAYGKSPWYFQYEDSLQALYEEKDVFLVDWNFRCLDWVNSAMRLQVTRYHQLAGSDRRISDPEYVFPGMFPENGGGGATLGGDPENSRIPQIRDLQDRIRPSDFQDPDLGPFPVYTQVFEDRLGFQPNLSILDLVLCCGPTARRYLPA